MRFLSKTRARCLLGISVNLLGCGEDPKPPLLGALEVFSQSALPNSADGRLVGTECPFPKTAVDANVECGRLSVPESRTGQSQRRLTLPVVVFRSASPAARDREPIVYLEGGPGGHAVQNSIAGFEQAFAPLTLDRDLVVFDQRGTGFAAPRLDCPELMGPGPSDVLTGPVALAQEVAELEACRARLIGSADLNEYDSRENAADVNDLRLALGLPAWHLLGVSYGTRLALDVLRYHAEGVKSVILDSVLPTDVDLVATRAEHFKRSLDSVFQACLEASDCKLAYPNLEQAFYELVQRLDKTPRVVANRSGTELQVTGHFLTNLVFDLSYSAQGLAILPELLFQLREGDFGIFEGVSFAAPPTSDGELSTFSIGMHLSVVCSDYVPFSSLEATNSANQGLPPALVSALGSADYFSRCQVWNVTSATSAERAPVTSDLPVLVLSGLHDPVTPPAWAHQVAQTLPNSRDLTFTNQSHGIISDPCAGALFRAYWDDPRSDPSARCPNRELPLAFEVLSSRLPGAPSGAPAASAYSQTPSGGREKLLRALNFALKRRQGSRQKLP